jgi:small subunit ribosomal protein S6
LAEKTLANPAKKWARDYETVYILRPTVDTEQAKKVADRIQEVMTKSGAKLTKVETWGVRRLAYAIAKHRRGIFVYIRFSAFGDVVAELERNLRLMEQVMRYQTIVIGERVDLDDVAVNAEEAVFDAIEKLEDEAELTTAQQLGMEERKPAPREEDAKADAEETEAAPAADAAATDEAAPAADAAEATEAAATETATAESSASSEEE